MDLFSRPAKTHGGKQPLAQRMRPRSLAELVGQRHLLGPGKMLAELLGASELPSLLLWGPPGSGKTTLAHLLAGRLEAHFRPLSAVSAGVKELREIVAEATSRLQAYSERTVLFIDEIHRFNKAQQDALLPHVEDGTVTLIGATTENPSFEVISALLSRCKVVTLTPLDEADLGVLVDRALSDSERGIGGRNLRLEDDARAALIRGAEGDARKALMALEIAAQMVGKGEAIDVARVEQALGRKVLLYDRAGEEHYNVISAFIKSMRGSDPDAAVYWMARMLEAGEDPLFILRRMVIFAAEDVGNADPRALAVVVAAVDAFRFVGIPEGVLPMTQAVIYLATAPKTNTALTTWSQARKDVTEEGALPVPKHLRNAPTPLMKGLGYGAGYQYPHNFEGNYVKEDYLPEKLVGRRYYEPGQNGYEREISERLAALEERKRRH